MARRRRGSDTTEQGGISATTLIMGGVAALAVFGAWWILLEAPSRKIREGTVDGSPPPQSQITAETPSVYCTDRAISHSLGSVHLYCSKLSVITGVQSRGGATITSLGPVQADIRVLSRSARVTGITHISRGGVSISFDPQEPAYLEIDRIGGSPAGRFHAGHASLGDVYKPDETIWTAADVAGRTYEADVDPLPPPSSNFVPIEISAPVALEPQHAAMHYRVRLEGISDHMRLPTDGDLRLDALGTGDIEVDIIASPVDVWRSERLRRSMDSDSPVYVRRIGITYASGFSLGVAGRAHANQAGLIDGDFAVKVTSIGVLSSVHPEMEQLTAPLRVLDTVAGQKGTAANFAIRNGEVRVNEQSGLLALLGNETLFKIPALP